jgi:hypothetical protein
LVLRAKARLTIGRLSIGSSRVPLANGQMGKGLLIVCRDVHLPMFKGLG